MFQRRRDSKTGYRGECQACLKLKKRKYFLANRQQFLLKRKEYYNKHKEEISELGKIDYRINPEKYKDRNKKWYSDNKENKKINSKKYTSSLKGRIATWKHSAKVRGLNWDLPSDYFEKVNMICFYTGMEMTFEAGKFNTISLDRRDSSKGYTKDNVVFCCQAINKMKFDLTFEQFIETCKIIGQRF